jgi:hypothetical protein
VTKASDNPYPSILIAPAGIPAAPTSSQQRLYYSLTSNAVYAIGSNTASRLIGPSTVGSTIDQDIGSDLVTNNTSTWTDVTGLTGISVGVGSWVAMVDIETESTANYGPVFRVTDGTTVYAQAGLIVNYIATVSIHTHFNSKPFTLSSASTLKVQYFTDTTMTIKKFPTRGASSTAVASHITFLKTG